MSEKERELQKLEKEFWKRIDAIPEPEDNDSLDGGYSPQQEVVAWLKGEVKKVELKYG